MQKPEASVIRMYRCPVSAYCQLKEPAILMGFSEVLFLQAEAAARGWINDEPKTLYNRAIVASFEYWDVSLDGDDLNSYLQQDGVAYDADNF
jgi:hypothetical protein